MPVCFCEKVLERREKILSHVRVVHSSFVCITEEDGKRTHEINYRGQLEVFRWDLKQKKPNIFRSFGLLANLISSKMANIEKLNNDQQKLLQFFNHKYAEFEQKFVTHEEFAQLRKDIDKNTADLLGHGNRLTVNEGKIETHSTKLAVLEQKVDLVEKQLKARSVTPVSAKSTLPPVPQTPIPSTEASRPPYTLKTFEILSNAGAIASVQSYINKKFIGIIDINRKWAEITIHFVMEILKCNCITSRSIDSEIFSFLEENCATCQKIKLVKLKKNGKGASNLDVVYAVWTNDTFDVVTVYDCNIDCNTDSDKSCFLSWLEINVHAGISYRFENINCRYLFEPLLTFDLENIPQKTRPDSFIELDERKLINSAINLMLCIPAENKQSETIQHWYSGSAVGQQRQNAIAKLIVNLNIGFVLDILTKIFGIQLKSFEPMIELENLRNLKGYELNGIFDVMTGRKRRAIDFGSFTKR